MSSATSKPPIKDPTRVPTAEEIDRCLGPFSRYARTVRGAARVSGLSARLTWTSSGWVEHLRMGESLIGIIHLNKSPPTAEIGLSKALEEALTPRLNNDLLKKAFHDADGINIKWIEMPVTGPEAADALASFVTLKTELIGSGGVPLSPAERAKPVVRPPLPHEAPRPIVPAANRAPGPTRPKAKVIAKPARKPAARPSGRVVAKATPAAKKAKPAVKSRPKAKVVHRRGR